jgi:hypothetical protein
VHRLGALERRTGSLFPPAARFELIRWTAATATEVLARVLTTPGSAAEPGLTEAVAGALHDDRGVLPAELQLVACALRDQRVATLADWRRLGGVDRAGPAVVGAAGARAAATSASGCARSASWSATARRSDELAIADLAAVTASARRPAR